jgi:hypothetical protein
MTGKQSLKTGILLMNRVEKYLAGEKDDSSDEFLVLKEKVVPELNDTNDLLDKVEGFLKNDSSIRDNETTEIDSDHTLPLDSEGSEEDVGGSIKQIGDKFEDGLDDFVILEKKCRDEETEK